jgi:two-component system, cell cycle response regulator DivK
MAKILVAEDSEPIWGFLQQRLERKGHVVILAHDGETAVSNAKSTQPDLILMEMNLPVMDGWTAARAIKGDTHTAAIPIIAIAANATADEREKALQAGCDAFHPKPIDVVLLLRQIDAALMPGEEDPPVEGDADSPPPAP